MLINGYDIDVKGGEMSEKEMMAYIDRGIKKYPKLNITGMEAVIDGDFVDIKYRVTNTPDFQRIRRITGYLVGTMNNWNNAKRAEEKDRIKHSA